MKNQYFCSGFPPTKYDYAHSISGLWVLQEVAENKFRVRRLSPARNFPCSDSESYDQFSENYFTSLVSISFPTKSMGEPSGGGACPPSIKQQNSNRKWKTVRQAS